MVDLSVAKLALQLWKQPVALQFMSTAYGEFGVCLDTNVWNAITGLIKCHARNIDIPLVLKKRLADALHQISDRIFEWLDEIVRINKVLEEPDIVRVFINRLQENLVFTGAYDQDQVSTAKSIVVDVQISLKLRFWVAVEFCQQEQVFKLWREMDEHTRTLLHSPPYFISDKLIEFWINWAQNKLEDGTYHPSSDEFDQMFDSIKHAMLYYIQNEAHRYFWDKATAEKCDLQLQLIVDKFSSRRATGLSMPFFIIQRLNRQELEKLVGNGAYQLLYSLARHRTDDINDILKTCVAKVPEHQFTEVLERLADYFYSPTLMEIVWNSTTIVQRRNFYENDDRLKVYKRIAQYGDRHVLERILLQATDGDRQLFSGTSVVRQSEQVGCARCSSRGGNNFSTPYQLCLHQLGSIQY